MGDEQLLTALRAAAVDGEYQVLRTALHPDVIWDDCRGAEAVIATLRSMLEHGMSADSLTGVRVDDRLVVTIEAMFDGHPTTFYLALVTNQGQVTHIIGVPDAESAATVVPPAAWAAGGRRAAASGVSPIFVVGDIDHGAAHYRALGFEVEHYGGDAAYGFARRDSVELHLAQHDGVDPLTTTSATYIYVDDAHALHAEWVNAGQPGRFREPEATDYGLVEGAHIDPWGNLIRYGSPLG